MKMRSTPRRLVAVAAPRNSALILSSLNNAVSSMSSGGPESVLILYDSDVARVTDIKRLANEAGRIDVVGGGNLEIETREIPVINDLIEQELPYMPREGDCILVPAMQLHIALLLERLAWATKFMGLETAYLCHTEPDGQSVEWKMVGHNPEGGFAVDTIALPQPSHDSLEWLLSDSGATYSRPATRFVDSKVEEFIELEERSYDGESVSYALLGLVGAESVVGSKMGVIVGKAFEEVTGHCFDDHDSIASVVINVEFAGQAKIFEDKKTKREEDVIALTKRGNLIYASCKYKGRSHSATNFPQKIAASMQQEVSRVKSLVLPINFPKERIKRMIITTTPAMQLAGETGEVIVTNLAGLSDSLKHL